MSNFVITSGHFNPFHTGHLALLKDSWKLAGENGCVFVIVNNDKQILLKNRPILLNEDSRVEILDSMFYVDTVIKSFDTDSTVSKTLDACLQEIKKKEWSNIFFTKGGDVTSENMNQEEKRICEKYGCTILYGVGGQKTNSSSEIINKIREYYTKLST